MLGAPVHLSIERPRIARNGLEFRLLIGRARDFSPRHSSASGGLPLSFRVVADGIDRVSRFERGAPNCEFLVRPDEDENETGASEIGGPVDGHARANHDRRSSEHAPERNREQRPDPKGAYPPRGSGSSSGSTGRERSEILAYPSGRAERDRRRAGSLPPQLDGAYADSLAGRPTEYAGVGEVTTGASPSSPRNSDTTSGVCSIVTIKKYFWWWQPNVHV